MRCPNARELISADLDGELAADEHRSLRRHLDDCDPCRGFADQAAGLHRSLRVQAAPPVPDLADAVLAGLAGTPRRDPALRWRVGLAVVGAVQLVLAGPALLRHPDLDAELHAVHHLNAWAVAFAVGLLVVAWQPWRVRGLLPIAATLAGVMVFTVALDVRNDHRIGMPATAHLLELAGLVLAWGLARRQRTVPPGGPAGGDGRRRRGWRARPAVPAWLRPGGPPEAWSRQAPAPASAHRRDRHAA